jgi:hypothetical protein
LKRITMWAAAIVGVLLLAVGITACTSSHHHANATRTDQNKSNDILAHFQTVQPAPQFDWSQIRQTLIDAETAQAQTTQTTTFFFNLGVADPLGWCPSIGYPVAGTSQITSPDKENDHGSYGQSVTAQIDPNGIFSGNTTATYVICVGENGKRYLHHVEEIAHAVGGPATWDYTHHRFQITGDPTFIPKTQK